MPSVSATVHPPLVPDESDQLLRIHFPTAPLPADDLRFEAGDDLRAWVTSALAERAGARGGFLGQRPDKASSFLLNQVEVL